LVKCPYCVSHIYRDQLGGFLATSHLMRFQIFIAMAEEILEQHTPSVIHDNSLWRQNCLLDGPHATPPRRVYELEVSLPDVFESCAAFKVEHVSTFFGFYKPWPFDHMPREKTNVLGWIIALFGGSAFIRVLAE
jgi:hypothetical protein